LEFAILKVLLSTRLPLHAYSILFVQPKLFNLPKCFSTFLEANNLQEAKVLQIHSSLAELVGLCEHLGTGPFMFGQTMNFMENLILMTLVFSLRVNMDEITKYAQLHLLFQASFLNIENKSMF
jgi:hypothetical protein